jgi:orotidine-5'-phosphate decarboxylase
MVTTAPVNETTDAQSALVQAESALSDPLDWLIVALDVPSAGAAMDLVDRLHGTCRWFKVDIPNTVAGAVRSVAGTRASLLTIHAGGGEQMMRAAAQAATAPKAPELLAVTVLTSMDAAELSAVGVADTPSEQVLRLARLAKTSGINGLVCSPEEVAAVRQAMGPGARLVVPGIRPAGLGASDDQRRVATPAQAITRGASMLVVGRPITQAENPAQAAVAILAEIKSAS